MAVTGAAAIPSGTSPSGGHSRELEAARGIAILLVILLHYGSSTLFFPKEVLDSALGPLSFIPRTGHRGVILFFVLSAFLLSRPFLREWMGQGRPSIANFFQRRALRILPAYYLAVAVAWLFLHDGPAAFRSLLFAVAPQIMHPFGDVWWSLRAEIEFYLLLGFGVLALRVPRLRWVLLGVLALYGLAYTAVVLKWVSGAESIPISWFHLFAFQWPAFAFGVLIAAIHLRWGESWQRAASESALLRRGGGDLVFAAILLAIAWAGAAAESMPYYTLLRVQPSWPLWEGLRWAAFVLAFLVLPLKTRRLFVNAPLEFLGRISYSLYLVHVPLLFLTATPRLALRMRLLDSPERTPGVALAELAAVAALAVLLSWASYTWVEKPFLAWKRRIAAPGSAPLAPGQPGDRPSDP